MLAVESIFDKTIMLGEELLDMNLKELQGDRLCNFTRNELHHENLLKKMFKKFCNIVTSFPLVNLKFRHREFLS